MINRNLDIHPVSLATMAADESGAGDDSGDGAGFSNALTRVLLVEDEPNILAMLAEKLSYLNFEVTTSSKASDALDLLTSSQPFDLLFTDIVLGKGMNGVELAHEATRRRPDIKILLTCGYPLDAMKEGTDLPEKMVFLQKPYRNAALVDALQRAMSDTNSSARDS